MGDILDRLYEMTAISNIAENPSFLLMYLIAFGLLYLGIVKKYEPLLLVPIAFGVLIANFPGGEMGVIQTDAAGMVTLADGTVRSIWDMPLHDIAHEFGIMNYLYYGLADWKCLPKWCSWSFGTGLGDNELFKIQSDTIREIAHKGSAIFVGRASDYVLRDMKCLDVFISAPFENRAKKMMDERGLSEREAELLIQRKDKERSDYYNFFTFTEWGVAANYDLCIDSAILGYNGTAEFIIEFGKRAGLL